MTNGYYSSPVSDYQCPYCYGRPYMVPLATLLKKPTTDPRKVVHVWHSDDCLRGRMYAYLKVA